MLERPDGLDLIVKCHDGKAGKRLYMRLYLKAPGFQSLMRQCGRLPQTDYALRPIPKAEFQGWISFNWFLMASSTTSVS
jgi:hypothetical protein